MFNTKNLIRAIYGLSLLFLLNSVRLDFIAKDVWNGLVDFEFIVFVIYMIWIYPKRKLKLNDDLMVFLLVYFSGYAIRNIVIQDWFKLVISVAFVLGYGSYRVYQKKHKYRFYLNR